MTADAPAVEPALDPVEVYLRQIETAPLTREQVSALWRRIDAGCEEARRQLIAAHLPLVVSMARKYSGRGLPLLDLIQEGNIGLMKAIERFDSRRGSSFRSYAALWIRHEMLGALDDQARAIRLPRYRVATIRKLELTRDALAQELGREPTTEEVAERLDLCASKVRELRGFAREPLSLEGLIEEAGDGDPREIEDANAVSPLEAALDSEACALLYEALKILTPRHARVLRLRFGLNGGAEKSYDEVARLFGVSASRIRQIQSRAMGKLWWQRRKTRLWDLVV